MVSINTNPGAAIGAQTLGKTNSSLSSTQNRVSTGLSVSGAKEDGSIFAIAQALRGDIEGLGASERTLNRAQATVSTAIAATEGASDVLTQLKGIATAATDPSLSEDQRAAYASEFSELAGTLDNLSASADFNGTNLVAASPDSLATPTGVDGQTVDTSGTAIDSASLGLAGADLTTAAGAEAALAAVDAASQTVSAAATTFSASASALEVQSVFSQKLGDALTQGVGSLVDADLGRESAKLQALQIKQQLGATTQSIANSSSQVALQFFQRG